MTDYVPGVGADDGFWVRTGSPPEAQFSVTDAFLAFLVADAVPGNFGLVYTWTRYPNFNVSLGELVTAEIYAENHTDFGADPTTMLAACWNGDNAIAPPNRPDANTQWGQRTAAESAPLDVAGMPLTGLHRLGDVTTSVAAVLGRAGWTPGNALMIFCYSYIQGQTPMLRRRIRSFEGGQPMVLRINGGVVVGSSGLYPRDGLSARPHF